jgi:spermidine/putrescine transport system substrate-binding protein
MKKLLPVFFICLFTVSVYSQEVLRILAWDGYVPENKIVEFEKLIKTKYGKDIKIQLNTEVSDPQNFYDALRIEKADIITPAHNIIKDKRFDFIEKNLLSPVDLSNVPNYKAVIPSMKNADYISRGSQVFGVPFAHGPYGLVYNTDKIKTAPDSWNVLWDPRYKGAYAVSRDYYEVNIYITALAMGYRGDALWDIGKLNNPSFKEKLNQLGKNAARFWIGVDTPDDLKGLSLGTSWGFSLPELKIMGENWKMAEPKEGATSWIDNFVLGASLMKNASLKIIAEEWLNFVISPEYQAVVVVRQLNSAPVNLQTAKLLTADEIKQHKLDDPDFFKTKRILWPTLNEERTRNFMKNIWNDALKGR